MKPLFTLLLTGCLLTVMGAAPSIGIVKSTGDFRVDGSTIRGNSTVFEGNLIETASVRSTVVLGDAEITLLPESRAKIYRDHTVLERGAGVVRDGSRHFIEASTLEVAPVGKDSVVQVEMTGPKSIKVFTLGSGAKVRNAQGVLVASMHSGMSLAFSAQAGAQNAVTMEGPLVNSNGKSFVTDKTTNVKAELRPARNLSACQGKNVTVTGSLIPDAVGAEGASQVIQVAKLEAADNACVAAIRSAGVAGGAIAGGAAPAAGLSTAATAAIIGGVAAGATVGGLAAAGTFSNNDKPVSVP